jgi:hypothetical protein
MELIRTRKRRIKMSDVEKQISVKLSKNAELAGAQGFVDAQLVNLPRRGFSLHIQFVEATQATSQE